jgi:hypothetical protein
MSVRTRQPPSSHPSTAAEWIEFYSEVILQKIAERLAAQYQITMTHLNRKKSPGHSVTPDVISYCQQKADFVLAGVGD